jgi:head-tail adaptor
MAARRGTERFLAGRELVEGTWILTMGFGQQIVESDRVSHAGVFYEVIFVDSSKSYNTATRVLLKSLD